MSSRPRGRPRTKAPGDCLTIVEFCQRNRISRQFYYKLRRRGEGPSEIRLGNKVLIAKEAAENWRRDMMQPETKA
jgi:hypothetical protein